MVADGMMAPGQETELDWVTCPMTISNNLPLTPDVSCLTRLKAPAEK